MGTSAGVRVGEHSQTTGTATKLILSPLFIRNSTARFDCVRASSTLLPTSAGISTGRLPILMIMSPTCKPLSADGLVAAMSVITTPRSAAPTTAFAGARLSPRTGGCSIFFSAVPSTGRPGKLADRHRDRLLLPIADNAEFRRTARRGCRESFDKIARVLHALVVHRSDDIGNFNSTLDGRTIRLELNNEGTFGSFSAQWHRRSQE